MCDHWGRPGEDRANLVLWRGAGWMMLLNRFPYNSGHLLIAPGAHVARLDDLAGSVVLGMMGMVRDAQHVLREAVKAQGFNVGLNFGRCAGAGLPGHMHIHVVPRWEGDTNFMPIMDDVRVMPQALEAMRDLLVETSRSMGLGAGVRA